jgi:hypothetical protein
MLHLIGSRVVFAAACTGALLVQLLLADGSYADVDPITIEGNRERAMVEQQVGGYVSAITVGHFHESLARWRTPICPLVAGLHRDHGEFILARVSQIAAAAGAPMAPEHCKGNFFIVVTENPDALLARWSARDTTMFGDAGGTKVNDFLSASTPVRVWYNARFDNTEGPLTANTPALAASGEPREPGFSGVPNNTHALGFRLARDEVRNLFSAIVLIDSRRAKGIHFGQLADYVAMAGLAEIHLNANVGSVPTILHLFSTSGGTPPGGLSNWDQAFLSALYHADQADITQLARIRISMMREMAP